ncbi:MAG: hypothetical protein HY704_08270 [Gemmatimonadetes bacterium]|nr:hypothetical protein [Gemmatimonadota bacterium]
MNKKQKIALWVGITLVALMGLVPPWKVMRPRGGGAYLMQSLGYAPLFSQHGQIDFGRLFVQWAVVAVVTGGLVLTFSEPPKS